MKKWYRKLDDIKRAGCKNLADKSQGSKDTPDIHAALYFLNSFQEDPWWDLDGLLMSSTKAKIIPRLSCTAYACLIIPRAEEKVNPRVEKGLNWLRENCKILLNGNSILDLAYCTYYLSRIDQVPEIPLEDYKWYQEYQEMLAQLAERLAELQINENGSWGISAKDVSGDVHVTAAAMRALHAFAPKEYNEQIEKAERFIRGYREWNDVRVISDVCVMLLEAHRDRAGSLVRDLIARIKNSQIDSGAFKRGNEPDVLTTSVAVRALTLHGERQDSDTLRKGLQFIHESRNKSEIGWPVDTNRHVCDPWTTVDVLHTLLHVERIVPTPVAFNALLRLNARIRDEVVTPLIYELETMEEEKRRLTEEVEELNKELLGAQQTNLELKNRVIELNGDVEVLKARVAQLEELVEKFKAYWHDAIEAVDAVRTNFQQREDRLRQEREEWIKNSGRKEFLEQQLTLTKQELTLIRQSNSRLRWVIGSLLVIVSILASVLGTLIFMPR